MTFEQSSEGGREGAAGMTGTGELAGEGSEAWRRERACRARPVWLGQGGPGETEEGSAPALGLGLSLCVRWEAVRGFWTETGHYVACKTRIMVALGQRPLVRAFCAGHYRRHPRHASRAQTLVLPSQLGSQQSPETFSLWAVSFPRLVLGRVKPVSAPLLLPASRASPTLMPQAPASCRLL